MIITLSRFRYMNNNKQINNSFCLYLNSKKICSRSISNIEWICRGIIRHVKSDPPDLLNWQLVF